ncbi:hypothetical protein STRCI_001303 [Streptomyces cinnabarinus]|uniref:Uncharacterized protein n=1 Tax=Streptomyces cinnabarinus TaxID=67287 RepID=A0ABY7K6R1_9ACTN|nr:hypothetical protein [Streptomyces cinnabarinus]WAZ20203.1 hypothetical protein STRCI_001303 [Streptomyces cinnabarinus]
MTATTVTPYPETPAEVARAVLDAIDNQPDAFDMQSWAYLTESIRLAPRAVPNCGTTLCAAGWVAHVTGWTLVDLPEDEEDEVTGRDEDGADVPTTAQCYAERGDERRLICDVAQDALGLTPAETFWYSPADTALKRLREIAGR